MRIKNRSISQAIKIALSLAFAALFFQNCSRVNFQEVTSDSNSLNLLSQTLIVNAKEKYQQTDILFVMDDSCSMNSIIENVKMGIESLSSVSFPEDTLVGVTYMSPALQDSKGIPVFEKAYFHVKNYADIDLIANSPGFMKLVDANSVGHFQNFISNISGVVDTFKSEMCEQTWFSPTQLSPSLTNTCLAAAMQSPLLCTGAEAGLVSLKQLIQKYQQSGQKLFRENSLAQIIFLSDTHDPGANYYGKTGALSAQPNYEELRALIYSLNPGLQGIRFSGILPLPRLGDPLLVGLNTIGKILGPDDSTSLTEETYQYSYLDFIKKSNGVALHAEQSDWSATITKLIEESATYKEVVVETLYPYDQIQSVFINDIRIELDQIEKINDNKIVIRVGKVTEAKEYKVVLNYSLQ